MQPIPEQIPAALADYVLQSWVDIGVGEMIIQIEMKFPGRLDAARLAAAHALLLDAEPVLGCRMVTAAKPPYWQRLPPEGRSGFCQVETREAFEKFRIESLDATIGPLVKICLWNAPGGDRLLLKVAHHAADAGGTKDVAAILADLYSRLAGDPAYRPLPNVTGCREFEQIIRLVPWRSYPTLIRNCLHRIVIGYVPKATHALRLPDGPRAPFGYVVRHFTPDRVARMAAYGRERGATLNDLLAAAYYRAQVAVREWDGRSALRLQITLDLRRWHLPNERAEAVCNLSGWEYPFLGRNLGKDFAETVDRVSSLMRQRKRSWPGLSEVLLFTQFRRFSYPGLMAFEKKLFGGAMAAGNFPNSFTNMGPIAPERLSFDGVCPKSAWLLAPPIYPPLFGAGLSGYAGGLTLSAGVPESARSAIEAFFDAIGNELPA